MGRVERGGELADPLDRLCRCHRAPLETPASVPVLEKQAPAGGLALGVAEVVMGSTFSCSSAATERASDRKRSWKRVSGEVGQDDLDRDATTERLVARLHTSAMPPRPIRRSSRC